jgi:transcriptional regulator with XRE-family HTH domain
MDTSGINEGLITGLRRLRHERRLTQVELALALGVSQPQLSKIEKGQGLISAQQLILLLLKYSLPLSYFIPAAKVRDEEDALQNALVYLGASHLREIPDVIVHEKFTRAEEAIATTLISKSSPRLIAALVPVIVKHCENINFLEIAERLCVHGIENRLWWIVEGTFFAVQERLKDPFLPRDFHRQYQTAFLLLERKKIDSSAVREHLKLDELDQGLISAKTVKLVKDDRDELAEDWGIITRIKLRDLVEFLQNSEQK